MSWLCIFLGHKRRVIAAMPGIFKGDPDQFYICKCDRCGITWPEKPKPEATP